MVSLLPIPWLELLEKNSLLVDDVLSHQIGLHFQDRVDECPKPLRPSRYVRFEEFGQIKKELYSLCVAQWNCHITSAFEEIVQFLSNIDSVIDVLGICESFLSLYSLLSSYAFPGYQLISKSRHSMGRGGLAFLVREGLNFEEREDLYLWNEGKIEIFSIEIEINNGKKLIVCLVYRPPGAHPEEFFQEFDMFLSRAQSNRSECVILGDFNFDLLNLNSVNLEFLNLALSHDLYPVNLIPSRITAQSATLIDNIFVSSNLLRQAFCDVLLQPASDHLPIVCMINSIKTSAKNLSKRVYRDMRNNNLRKLKEQVSTIAWDEVSEEQNATTAFDRFMNILLPVYEASCPLRKMRKKKNEPRKPWVTTELLEMMEMRNQLFEKHLQSPENASLFEEFKRVRNKVNHKRRSEKKAYYASAFDGKSGDAKGTWRLINEVLKGKTNDNDGVKSLMVNGSEITDKQEMADEFGKYFTNIGASIKEDVAKKSRRHLLKSFIDNRGEGHSFSFEKCTAKEIESTVKGLKSNSAGIDGLNLRAVNAILVYILPCLTDLINLSLQTGEFPSGLKLAKVIPLYKGGNKQELSNWRPISLLPIFSKIYEKIIHRRLYEYLDKLGILCDSQFGFRSKHSTSHAVHHLLDVINGALEKGLIPLTIFVDFKKAFDTVDFELLLCRLSSLGIKDVCLDWFKSYLYGRSTKVMIDDIVSGVYPVKCGVPQGSVLGPLLFLVYIDTLRFYMPEATVTAFADDTALTISAQSLEELVDKANRTLENLLVFTSLSYLAVNTSKTNYMIFSRVGKIVNSASVVFENLSLSQVFENKYLGFYVDNNLSWKKHMNMISSKLARGLGVMRRLKHVLPLSVLRNIYHTVFHPFIVYGCCIYASNFTSNIKRLQIL